MTQTAHRIRSPFTALACQLLLVTSAVIAQSAPSAETVPLPRVVTPPPATPFGPQSLPPGATQGVAPQGASSWSWFGEAGAYTGNTLLGGLGVSRPVAATEEIFAEAALQTGTGISQSSTLLIGIKSNYPAITLHARKLVPISIVGYGASIASVLKTKPLPPGTFGLTAASVTAIATGAGFAQRYAVGFETAVRSWNIGLGVSRDRNETGWKVYPFVFVAREFGEPRK